MKPLKESNKSKNAVLDNILDDLKSKQKDTPKVSDSMVDELLSEVGLRKKVKNDDIKQKQTAAMHSAAKEVQPRSARKKPLPQPAATKNAPVAKVANAVKEKIAKKEDKTSAEVSSANKSANNATSQWDKPRLGKAAAMDKVEKDKFVNDDELMRWYEPNQGMPLSRKEEKQAQKQAKKSEAKEKRLAKQQKNYEPKEAPQANEGDDGEYFEAIEKPQENENFENEATEIFAKNVKEKVVLGSAFDVQEQEWDETESLFKEKPATKAAAPTMVIDAVKAVKRANAHDNDENLENYQTKTYAANGEESAENAKAQTPTAAFTQEFDAEGKPIFKDDPNKSLFVDEMVDDRFRKFFSETVMVDQSEVAAATNPKLKTKLKKKNRNTRTLLLTGEFAQMAEQAQEAEEEEFDDYNKPQDAEQVEADISALKTKMTQRTIATAIIAVLLGWCALAYAGAAKMPQQISPQTAPLVFSVVYLVLVAGALAVNFPTISSGLVGMAGQPTMDTPPALAGVASLLQAVALVLQGVVSQAAVSPQGVVVQAVGVQKATLFGVIMALILAFNTFGKRVRVRAVLDDFQLASAGFDHSAGYVLNTSQEVAYHITRGLQEDDPNILISRPTALVKGFLRQSFSQRRIDANGRIIGFILAGFAVIAAVSTYFISKELMFALSSFAAVFCIGAPFSSSLVSAVPSALLQRGASKVGAVVPGWSAIEELGDVNIVMAGARDIFPPSTVSLKGIKTFQKERVDLAILYAASILIEGCDTIRDIFLGVIQSQSEMLYKVENLSMETGRGFTAWVENNRVVIGNREMLQKHGISPPPMEVEMKHIKDGCVPVYLAVSGRLCAMFIVAYTQNTEVKETLHSLVKSGLSLLVTSEDMNVTSELIEKVYELPKDVIKVLGRKELEIMQPLTAYAPESDGVMTHLGTFTSFIGGMRAAAGCASAERMSGIVQMASVALAMLICVLLVFSQGLPILSIGIILLYQVGWTVLVSGLPFLKRY